MESQNWTGPLPDLSERYKTVIDDIPDYQIQRIAKMYIPPTLQVFRIRDKHGEMFSFGYIRMTQIRYYCQYLVAIGAVKDGTLLALPTG